MAPHITGFNHTSCTVADLDATLAFLVDGLGLKLVSRGPRDQRLIERMSGVRGADLEIAFVEGPGHRIELIRYLAPPDRRQVPHRLCDVPAWHIGFDVADLDEVLAIAARHGFTLAGEIIAIDAGPNAGRRVCYVRNRDGMTFEFLETVRPAGE